MARSVTRSPFGVPSRAPLSDKIAWLSEARHFYKMKLLELEHQFETRVAELNEEYLAIILQVRDLQEQREVGNDGGSRGAQEERIRGNDHAMAATRNTLSFKEVQSLPSIIVNQQR
jgi:hypothetical protein